jgi:hypothetical protein
MILKFIWKKNMYVISSRNPVYEFKGFFDCNDRALAYLWEVCDRTLVFYNSMEKSEWKNYGWKGEKHMHKYIQLISFPDDLKNLFGAEKPMTAPKTNEEVKKIIYKRTKQYHLGKGMG